MGCLFRLLLRKLWTLVTWLEIGGNDYCSGHCPSCWVSLDKGCNGYQILTFVYASIYKIWQCLVRYQTSAKMIITWPVYWRKNGNIHILENHVISMTKLIKVWNFSNSQIFVGICCYIWKHIKFFRLRFHCTLLLMIHVYSLYGPFEFRTSLGTSILLLSLHDKTRESILSSAQEL